MTTFALAIAAIGTEDSSVMTLIVLTAFVDGISFLALADAIKNLGSD